MNFQAIARALDPKLYALIQPYRVTDEALMPEEYRAPNGRWKHDDWAVFKDTTRKECAYRVPLPFKITGGDAPITEEWMLWDQDYPTARGTRIETRPIWANGVTHNLSHALVQRAGYGTAIYSAWINGEWVPVFTKYTGIWFGKRLSWYKGLHQDLNVSPPTEQGGKIRSDLMCWFPELACSWVKEI